jgi:hypothetical protein
MAMSACSAVSFRRAAYRRDLARSAVLGVVVQPGLVPRWPPAYAVHRTEPRGVVGFEVILGAYASLLSMAATGSVSLVS